MKLVLSLAKNSFTVILSTTFVFSSFFIVSEFLGHSNEPATVLGTSVSSPKSGILTSYLFTQTILYSPSLFQIRN